MFSCGRESPDEQDWSGKLTKQIHDSSIRGIPTSVAEGGHGMLRAGEKVYVKTEVKDGAFPTEKLVTVSTNTGLVTGFAKVDSIIDRGGGQYLLAEVKSVSRDNLTVKLAGSFFTTTGFADVSSSMVLEAS